MYPLICQAIFIIRYSKTIYVPINQIRHLAQLIFCCIKCQRNRRNLTAAEIIACIAEVDKLKSAGRPADNKLAPCGANYGKSAAETAETVGVSTRTVERARAVIDNATPEIKQAVESGEMTINAAYNAIKGCPIFWTSLLVWLNAASSRGLV